MPTKILFVFGSQLLIEGIKALVAKIFPEASFSDVFSLNELDNKLRADKWDLLIFDADQGLLFSSELLNQVKKVSPKTNTVFMYENITQKVLLAYREGLRGCFSKTDSRENIELAIKTVLSGQVYVPQSVILKIICEGHVFSNLEHQISLLSEKEKEMLSYLSQGKRMKEITQLMNLAPSTLSTHKHRIMRKMSLNSSQEFNSFLKAYSESLKKE